MSTPRVLTRIALSFVCIFCFTVVCACVSLPSASYELKSLHTLTRHHSIRSAPVAIAHLRVDSTHTQQQQQQQEGEGEGDTHINTPTAFEVTCGESLFTTPPLPTDLASESPLSFSPLLLSPNPHRAAITAATQIINTVKKMRSATHKQKRVHADESSAELTFCHHCFPLFRFFPSDRLSPDGSTVSRTTSLYLLLHDLPSRVAVNRAADSDPDSTAGEFGGWPTRLKPCARHTTKGGKLSGTLDCCNIKITYTDAHGKTHHSVAPLSSQTVPTVAGVSSASSGVGAMSGSAVTSAIDPTTHPHTHTHPPTHPTLLDWRRAIHTLSSATPLVQAVSAPSHLPPSRSQRHAFLRAAIRRAELVRANSRPLDHPSRPAGASSLLDSGHPVAATVVSFVERSGWSSTSLADVLTAGVEPGMSPRTQAMTDATEEDHEKVASLMTDVTTTFLQAMEQVKVHMRAGVGAKQIISLICDKLVLRDMPPKVGLAITQSLQQVALNLLEETVSDMLTQYLVPPDSVGAFIEKRSNIHMQSATAHSIAEKTIAQVAESNPIVANEMENMELDRMHEQVAAMRHRERQRHQQMEQTAFIETQTDIQARVETRADADASAGASADVSVGSPGLPLGATIEFPDPPSRVGAADGDPHPHADQDKYSSFLSTYSASAIRHASHVGVSGDAIGERIKDYLGPMLTNGIIHDASAQAQNVLHALLHESLSNKLHEDISKSVVESLTPALSESVSASQVELLSVSLRAQLTREMTHHLTKSLTLLLTPALAVILTRALTRSPHADYYCHLCANPVDLEKPAEFHLDAPEGADPEKPYCLSCEHAKEHEYYNDYFAAYYARYYSSYFSFYYGDHYAAKFNADTLGTCKTQPCVHAL